MGYSAGFEEKEYETLMNASIASRASMGGAAPRILSPGQVLELHLGYDFAAYIDPSSSLYRLLYGQYPGPVVSAPGPLAPLPVPPGAPVVNSFLQYKRPEYFTAKHRQPVWRGQPFLRFGVRSRYVSGGSAVVDHRQLEALVRLANRRSDVLVRYLCPSVWTRAELYGSFQSGRLLRESCAVDPRHLERPDGAWHDYWTFDPLNSRIGQGNPGGSKHEVEDGDALIESMAPHGRSGSKGVEQGVEELVETVRELRRDFKVFDRPSELSDEPARRTKTKREAIEDAPGLMERSLRDGPVDEDWVTKRSSNFGLEKRRLRQEDRATVENFVEVAATAVEVGLKWVVAV